MTDDPKRATVDDIRRRLHDRFPADRGWLCMDEVTPPVLERRESHRRFDAIAISLWASHGQQIHGFEIKVSRADWRNELANPAKSGALMRWCDRYWLVCPPDVTDGADLPPGWGLLHATGDCLRTKRQAPTLTPVPRDGAFWCCMLLRLHQRTPSTPEEITAARDKGYAAGVEDGKRTQSWEAERAQRSLKTLSEQVDAFEAAAGFRITGGWGHGERVAAAVGLLADADLGRLADKLADQARGLREAADRLDAVATALVPAPTPDHPAPAT